MPRSCWSVKRLPSPPRKKLQEMLARIPGLVYGLRSDLFHKAVKQMATGLPRKRAGGPKPRLGTPTEKNQACAQIAALVGQGVKLRGPSPGWRGRPAAGKG